MTMGSSLELNRDCAAVQIPAGNTVMLPAGTTVDVTQNLGGAITVQALGALFSIARADADALGLDPDNAQAGAAVDTPAGPVSEENVWAVLKTCYDPEIPVNLVDLGLIYDVVVNRSPDGPAEVEVKMTLTAPGCGMGPMIARDAQAKIAQLPGVRRAEVSVVWDPPWHQAMITAEGRRILGLE
jgi:probable FeS assembly SUF system protein SufT